MELRYKEIERHKKPPEEYPFVQPQMRYTSKSSIERIIEIYSRNNTKDSDKMTDFINANQGATLKSKAKKTVIGAEDDDEVKEPVQGTITYEEMKRKKEKEKDKLRSKKFIKR